MVLLHCGTDANGKPYLDQATVGGAFRLSRQMTNARIASYGSRNRIEDYFFLESFFESLSFLGFFVSFFWLLLPFATIPSLGQLLLGVRRWPVS